MGERLIGPDACLSDAAKQVGEETRPASVAPEPGSAPGSDCSRSRSRSPKPVAAGADEPKRQQQLPSWVAVGQRVGYLSRSSGRYCEVDIDSMDQSEVKIVFAENRKAWKGIPFSMIL